MYVQCSTITPYQIEPFWPAFGPLRGNKMYPRGVVIWLNALQWALALQER